MFTRCGAEGCENLPSMTTPGHHGDARRGGTPVQMRSDLVALLAEVEASVLSAGEFRERLLQIHARHLASQANAPEFERSRRKAIRAFNALTLEAPSRHHQLEQLADALGLAASSGAWA